MALVIYNTMKRRKEPFKPLEPGRVRMYVCGPTVYDEAHVGHAMMSVVFDVIRRYLEYSGYEVTHVMNYTDVDDKVIQRANELGRNPLELAEEYIDAYDRHMVDLNILPPTVRPRASEEMDQIIKLVEQLVEKGHGYPVDGDVFFRVATDEDYGKLSGRRLEDMRAGFRIEVDERKEDPADFALWKAAKPGEPAWDSPWGKGRPGWHIECSAMSMHHLGEQIDIHGGGNDLVFPHHENEIAQSESVTGKTFARYWVHNGMMQLSGADMSKSTGNVFAVDAFLREHEADVFRLLVLNSSYRNPLTFNEEVLQQAGRGLDRMRSALRPAAGSRPSPPQAEADLAEKVARAREGFKKAMDDDFNTPAALASIFDLVRSINQARDVGVGEQGLGEAQAGLHEFAGVLGLQLEARQDLKHDIAPFLDLLIEIRDRLREEKQFELSDVIRKRLAELGVQLEDGAEGTTWRIV
ncbi:MAG: cysteine--tRNA ligase [Anaerolineales bacterium]|jgi:cysteinyl-tRNA synthetase